MITSRQAINTCINIPVSSVDFEEYFHNNHVIHQNIIDKNISISLYSKFWIKFSQNSVLCTDQAIR